jgi:2-polyprenyl-3-methyl-5-hydroxy-6-metoxy-1,4-benzoquinol methylase
VSAPHLREAEIRPDELMAEQARRYQADVDWLLTQRAQFVAVRCPACGAGASHSVWSKYGLQYLGCDACETVYMSPRPNPELLAAYYRRSLNYEYWNDVVFPASEELRREKIFRPRAERTVEIARRHGTRFRTLVDVGAGFGTFCEEVQRLGAFERVVAIEPEPHLAETCRRKGIEVIEAPVEEAAATLGDADVITSFEVIEHLFSPRELIEQCGRLLSQAGLVVLTCPNVKGFDVLVLGELSATVDAEHLNYMHPESLGSLLEQCGLEVLESQTPGRLDAELVRKKALSGELSLDAQPFLRQVLVERWEQLGGRFQDFLAEAGLSSNMWLVGRAR